MKKVDIGIRAPRESGGKLRDPGKGPGPVIQVPRPVAERMGEMGWIDYPRRFEPYDFYPVPYEHRHRALSLLRAWGYVDRR